MGATFKDNYAQTSEPLVEKGLLKEKHDFQKEIPH